MLSASWNFWVSQAWLIDTHPHYSLDFFLIIIIRRKLVARLPSHRKSPFLPLFHETLITSLALPNYKPIFITIYDFWLKIHLLSNYLKNLFLSALRRLTVWQTLWLNSCLDWKISDASLVIELFSNLYRFLLWTWAFFRTWRL